MLLCLLLLCCGQCMLQRFMPLPTLWITPLPCATEAMQQPQLVQCRAAIHPADACDNVRLPCAEVRRAHPAAPKAATGSALA